MKSNSENFDLCNGQLVEVDSVSLIIEYVRVECHFVAS